MLNFIKKLLISIDNTLVSDEIISEEFVCNISKCKGECCVAGEAGAPQPLHHAGGQHRPGGRRGDRARVPGAVALRRRALRATGPTDTHATLHPW